jgi:hypothetical protein
MNRLLNVSRQDGFPWCAETVEALNSNARYIESIMDGFGVGGRQAIILSDQSNGTPIMYIKDAGWEHGKIVKTRTSLLAGSSDNPTRANLLANPNKYALRDVSQLISINKGNSDTEVYPDCIAQEKYEIVLTANSGLQGWEFFEMADFFERERWITIPNNVVTLTMGQVHPVPMNATLGDNSIIRYNKFSKTLDVYIELNFSGTPDNYCVIKIPEVYANDMGFVRSRRYPLMAFGTNAVFTIQRNIPAVIHQTNYASPQANNISIVFNLSAWDLSYSPYCIFINGSIRY